MTDRMWMITLLIPAEIEAVMRRENPADTLPLNEGNVKAFIVGVIAGRLFTEDRAVAVALLEANPLEAE